MFVVASSGDPAARLRNLPPINVVASDALATTILGKRSWGRSRRAHRTGNLSYDSNPQDEHGIGVFGDLIIVAGDEAGSWIEQDIPDWGAPLIASRDVDAFCLHSVVSMGGFAAWRHAESVRAFAGAEDYIIIDEGQHLPFENSLDPDEDGYEMIAEHAMLDRLGFCFEGPYSEEHFDPETVPLLMYR